MEGNLDPCTESSEESIRKEDGNHNQPTNNTENHADGEWVGHGSCGIDPFVWGVSKGFFKMEKIKSHGDFCSHWIANKILKYGYH